MHKEGHYMSVPGISLGLDWTVMLKQLPILHIFVSCLFNYNIFVLFGEIELTNMLYY